MSFRSIRARALACALVALALVGASATVASGASAVPARASSSITKTATSVPGLCSSPSGFLTNASGTVQTLRMTVSPAAPRARSKVRVQVYVKQDLSTPLGASYPKHILQPQVVVGLGAKTHTLRGGSNAHAFTGAIFAKGFTAKGSFKAPKRGTYKLTVHRIVFNAIGGFSGTWGLPYSGFDVVCSGGANPTLVTTPYAHPRIKVKTRKHA